MTKTRRKKGRGKTKLGPYPFELRLRVVRMYLEEEYPVSMICQETGVGRSTIFLSLNSVKCYPIYLAKLLTISRVAQDREDIIGVELLIDPDHSTVQLYSLASSEKGYGRKIVDAVVNATPDHWNLVVAIDYSGGFWEKMVEEYPRIVVF